MNWWRPLSSLALTAIIFVTARTTWAAQASPKSDRLAVVMTYNVYFGADLTPIFSAPTQTDLLEAVAAAWANVKATNIPKRAAEIADEIATVRPALVGLQEAARWSTGSTPDAPDLQYDFVQLILSRLKVDHAHYRVVTLHNDLDSSAPMLGQAGLVYVRLQDRDVLLARTDLPLQISHVESGTFASTLILNNPVLGSIEVPRAWISADVRLRGRKFRVVTTHLESYDASIQQEQAQELIDGPANTNLPIVMVGDYNSDANGGPYSTLTYQMLLDDGFHDAWTETNPSGQGNTCCQTSDLSNQDSELSQRIDLVLLKGGLTAGSSRLINAEAQQAPYWPSDHAALAATVQFDH